MFDTKPEVDCEDSPDGSHWWGPDEYDNRCQWCDRKPWYETATAAGRARKAERENAVSKDYMDTGAEGPESLYPKFPPGYDSDGRPIAGHPDLGRCTIPQRCFECGKPIKERANIRIVVEDEGTEDIFWGPAHRRCVE